MNNNDYIRLSLELHLFFDRIMKEHNLFLEVAFLEKNNNLKPIARKFQNAFANILKKTIILANGNVTNNLLESNEIVTKILSKQNNKPIIYQEVQLIPI